MKIVFIIIIFISFKSFSLEYGSETGLKIPRYVSIKSNDANVRIGPSINYPIVIKYVVENYPIRGLQGAVGTKLDQITLLKGDKEKVKKLDEQISEHFGCRNFLNSVGQVYPRSLDMETVNALITLSSGISNFARTIRLMAGQGLASEGFKSGQIGSSAMPHKINARTSERINGIHNILKGYGTMLAGLSGDQWNEGDVSCSVVRRVAIPGSFFASDGQLEACLTVITEMEFFEKMIVNELKTHLPFVATTKILMECLNKGSNRKDVYEAIKEHSNIVSIKLRQGEIKRNDLPKRISKDKRVPLNLNEIEDILANPQNFLASAPKQSENFSAEVDKWIKRFPESKKIEPEKII